MSEDRSLDEFASRTDEAATDEGEEAGSSGEDAGSGGEEAGSGGGGVVEPSAVTPAVATSRFAPDGAACGGCGATVERLWVADGDEVCVDCKSW